MSDTGALEIEQARRFQWREWQTLRVGRFLLLAVLVLAVIGLFGAGPISSTSSSTDGALEVDIQHLGRRTAVETFAFTSRAA